MDILPTCPACGAALKKMPQRKTKCPACGSFIFIKYSPSNRVKRLVTEAEAEQIEAEWKAHGRLEADKALQERFGISPEAHASLRRQMLEGFGAEDADWNVEYYLLRQQFAQPRHLGERAFIAFQLAIMLNQRGLDFAPYLKVHFHEKLLGFQKTAGTVKGVEIRQADERRGVCDICRAGHGQQLALAEALKKSVLPHRGCTCNYLGGRDGYCECDYRPLFDGEMTKPQR